MVERPCPEPLPVTQPQPPEPNNRNVTVGNDASGPIVTGDGNHIDNRTYINHHPQAQTEFEIDFQPYREAVIRHYSQQRHLYTPTDALLPLEAQSVARSQKDNAPGQEPEKKVEQFPVLAGLRKYVLGNRREHVLLAGRPGSGKSTALRQLTVALAEEGLVPVFVQLKGDRPVLELIQAEFRRMKQRVTPKQIDDWLLDDQLVLLLDGINEIPNDNLRRSLAEFRDANLTVPMIFTTRDLSLGGDLGVDKRLEMKPLSEPQMREFVGKYLPEQGDSLLGQLGDRLRELAETPLLLKMLCDLFRQTGKIPQSKGELFRGFDAEYDRFKGLPAVSAEFRRFKPEILQQLAWVMMQGDPANPTEPWLTLPRTQAESLLEQWLTHRVSDPASKAKEWLEDLLEHYLLQVAANPRQVEFHHQLFQEYYAAEALLLQLPTITDDQLKQDYLNYLKWTEPLALMLALVAEEAPALRVVKLAMNEVDLMLGARLAGEVQPALQATTVGWIDQKTFPIQLKIQCWAASRSERAIPGLLKALEDPDWDVRQSAAEALGEIGSEQAIPGLLKALEHPDSDVRQSAAQALGEIGSERAIPGLLNALEHPFSYVRERAAVALGQMGSERAIDGLLKALEDSSNNVRGSAAYGLGQIESEVAIGGLLKALKDPSSDVRESAAFALGRVGNDAMIPSLLQVLEDINDGVRRSAAISLSRIGGEATIQGLLKALKHPNNFVRGRAAFALGQIGSKAAIPGLLQALEDSSDNVRGRAAFALGQIGSKAAIPDLIKALEDSSGDVRGKVAIALGQLGSDAAIPDLLKVLENQGDAMRRRAAIVLNRIDSDAAVSILLKALKDQDQSVRLNAAEALGWIGSEAAIPDLIKALEDQDKFVRYIAAQALGQIGSEAAVPSLLKALEDQNMRWSAAKALGQIGSERAIDGLLKALEHPNLFVLQSATQALGQIGNPKPLATLWKQQLTSSSTDFYAAISAIQDRCQFYNYEIWQAAQTRPSPANPASPSGNSPVTYAVNAEVVQIIENNSGTLQGKSTP